MKKLLFSFIMMLGMSLYAQNHITVYGNVGVQNVNISVLNTEYGTSSDIEGNYIISIFKSEHDVILQYSCIGYSDTLIVLHTKYIKDDTIQLSFKMKEETQVLDPVAVFGNKITRYQEQKYVIMDFEIYDDMFMILQRNKNTGKDYRVLITNILYDAVDTISLPIHITPYILYKDCDEQCQIIANDSVYQIVRHENKYSIGFPTERSYFINVLYNCLFVTDDWIYIKKAAQDSYNELFYRVNVHDKQNELLFRSFDEKSSKEYADEMSFYTKHLLLVGGMVHGPNPEEWSVFLKKAWIRPKSSYLDIVGDTLYYFNHVKSVIEAYDEDLNLLRTSKITYPEKESFWRFKIYQDKAFGRFYTIFGDKFNEIDVKSGKTYPRATVNQHLNQKIIIYKGAAYTLKRRMDSGNTWVSYIDRIKL